MHTYRVALAGQGLQDIVSILPEQIVFERGLVPQAVVGKLLKPGSAGGTLTPANFVPNRAFVEFLHEVIATHAPREAGLIAEAKRQGTGRVYMIDGRTPTPQGEVPPFDIIGAFRVEAGILTAGSYEGNQNHVLLSDRGFFRLMPGLHDQLVSEVMKRYSTGQS